MPMHNCAISIGARRTIIGTVISFRQQTRVKIFNLEILATHHRKKKGTFALYTLSQEARSLSNSSGNQRTCQTGEGITRKRGVEIKRIPTTTTTTMVVLEITIIITTPVDLETTIRVVLNPTTKAAALTTTTTTTTTTMALTTTTTTKVVTKEKTTIETIGIIIATAEATTTTVVEGGVESCPPMSNYSIRPG